MIPTNYGILQQKQAIAAYLSVYPTTITRDHSAGTASFDITASGSWTLAEFGKIDWISENLTNGTGDTTIIVTFTENTGEQRETDITITQGILQAVVHVIQYGIL
jgi:hypothetical protein